MAYNTHMCKAFPDLLEGMSTEDIASWPFETGWLGQPWPPHFSDFEHVLILSSQFNDQLVTYKPAMGNKLDKL